MDWHGVLQADGSLVVTSQQPNMSNLSCCTRILPATQRNTASCTRSTIPRWTQCQKSGTTNPAKLHMSSSGWPAQTSWLAGTARLHMLLLIPCCAQEGTSSPEPGKGFGEHHYANTRTPRMAYHPHRPWLQAVYACRAWPHCNQQGGIDQLTATAGTQQTNQLQPLQRASHNPAKHMPRLPGAACCAATPAKTNKQSTLQAGQEADTSSCRRCLGKLRNTLASHLQHLPDAWQVGTGAHETMRGS
jgi:hypothetical protein